ncbi:MAG: hypothetical protein AAF651_06880 [Cyanobacteria bacterium P01_C01_bin.73]
MNKLKEPIDEGWSVHIYDRRRRLLCTLEPSHGWVFLLGCLFGLGLAITWANLAQPRSAPAANAAETPLLQID